MINDSMVKDMYKESNYYIKPVKYCYIDSQLTKLKI